MPQITTPIITLNGVQFIIQIIMILGTADKINPSEVIILIKTLILIVHLIMNNMALQIKIQFPTIKDLIHKTDPMIEIQRLNIIHIINLLNGERITTHRGIIHLKILHIT